MKACIVITILAGTSCLAGCKTSNFRGRPVSLDVPVEEETPTPVKPTPQTPAEPGAVPVTPTTIDATVTTLQINQSCEKPVQLLSEVRKVSFPAPSAFCSFDKAPNLAPIEGYVQAREFIRSNLQLPTNAEICGITLESAPAAQLRYDDFIVLTIDDFIIYASHAVLVKNMTKVNNMYKWDFSKVVGAAIGDFKEPGYCVGAPERCIFPGTEMTGPVSMKLNYADISGITKAIQGKTSVPFDMIATGDNDVDKDCAHTGLDLTVTMTYIKKPNP